MMELSDLMRGSCLAEAPMWDGGILPPSHIGTPGERNADDRMQREDL